MLRSCYVPPSNAVDLLIITIKGEEHEAIRRRLPSPEVRHLTLAYHFADVETSRSRLCVALTRSPGQGNVHAQDTATKAIVDVNPRWILVVGIAGGFPSVDYTLGDVIVSSRFVDWTREAITEAGIEYDMEGGPLVPAARRVSTLIPTIDATGTWNDPQNVGPRPPPPNHEAPAFKTTVPEWRESIARSLEHHARHPRSSPRALSGSVVASDRLVKSGVVAGDLKHFARSTLAVEMESWGVYVAVDGKIPFLAVRGISDIVGLDRDHDWTLYACETAAAFAMHLIHSGHIEASLSVGGAVPGGAPAAPPAPAEANATTGNLALGNITSYGDTDVLPFPFELHAFREQPQQALSLLQDHLQKFDARFAAHPPQHERTLVRAGYAGFRWVTQLDPLWNAVFLSQVLSLSGEIEQRRIPTSERSVFSYRFAPNLTTSALFADDLGWAEFRATVEDLAKTYPYAVRTDIADFYPRVSHARLKLQVNSCDTSGVVADRLLRFLGNYVNFTGIGLPVGGPASRILSELALDDVDHILASRRIRFIRFADDYVLFANSAETAHETLSILAKLLYQYEGLSLQKLKTRVVSAAELRASLMIDADPDVDQEAASFLRIPLRYNPYSPTSETDYEVLREHVNKHNVLGMLAREMNKTRVHEQLTRRLIQAVRFMDQPTMSGAALTLVEALDLLSPLLPTVFIVLRQVYTDLAADAQAHIARRIREVLGSGAVLRSLKTTWSLGLDSERAFALRVMAMSATNADDALLEHLYKASDSVLLKRDIVLLRLQIGSRHFLDELFTNFGRLSRWERRAALAGSFAFGARGRDHRARQTDLDPFEQFVAAWAEKRPPEAPAFL